MRRISVSHSFHFVLFCFVFVGRAENVYKMIVVAFGAAQARGKGRKGAWTYFMIPIFLIYVRACGWVGECIL